MSVSISVGWAVLDFYEDPLVVSVFGKALGLGGGGGGGGGFITKKNVKKKIFFFYF
jgi:hypothetical protein